jgi:2-polyprenyl-6-methoxyphenol hydroxylase-like FAD-dependent oxidoreductase
MLAAELRLGGVPVTVLERRPNPPTESYARLLHGRTAELLDQRGLLDRLGGPDLPRWPSVHFALIPMDLTKADPAEYWQIVGQHEVERALAEHAAGLGADIRRGHELTDLTQDGTGVTATVRGPSSEYQLSGAYLVGCDGNGSLVREAAGFEAAPIGPSWYGVVAHVEGYQGPTAPVAGAPGIFGAIPDASFHHVMTTEFGADGPGRDVPVSFDEVRASVRRVTGQDITGGRPRWMDRCAAVTRLPAGYRKDRFLLAGDAAHTHFHAVGHGLNTGLHDAANLGWKLAAEITGWAPPGLLDTYEAERHPVGERAVRVMLAQLALFGQAPEVNALRGLLAELTRLDAVVKHLVGAITEVRYPLGHGSPLLGRQVPPLTLAVPGGPSTVAQALRAGRGLLLDLSGGTVDRRAIAGYADRVDHLAGDAPGVDEAALLIRPDGYVAWTGPGDGLADAVRTWFGEPARAGAVTVA